MDHKDSNGNTLQDGDNVALIKDLKMKKGGTLKRGMVARNISLDMDDSGLVEGKIAKVGEVVLKTEFVKKV